MYFDLHTDLIKHLILLQKGEISGGQKDGG